LEIDFNDQFQAVFEDPFESQRIISKSRTDLLRKNLLPIVPFPQNFTAEVMQWSFISGESKLDRCIL
jgi:hypothetical protein